MLAHQSFRRVGGPSPTIPTGDCPPGRHEGESELLPELLGCCRWLQTMGSEPCSSNDWAIEVGLRRVPEVRRVAEVEDGTKSRGNPVAGTIGAGEDGSRRVGAAEVCRRRRTEIGSIAIAEHLAIAQEGPITIPDMSGGRRNDRALSGCAEIGRIAEGIDVPS